MPNRLSQNIVSGARAVCRTSLVLTTAFSFSIAANAWGVDGHRAVANLAEARLSTEAKAEVIRLLAIEPEATLASVSTYADEHRDRSTARWHYVNFPRDSCNYQVQRDCPDGQCVIAALDTQVKVLASKAPDEQRLLALKWVVHLVGDIHQPLHAGYGDDRGGNSYQLQAFGRGTNLHALWDVGLIRGAGDDAVSLTKRLLTRQVPPSETARTSAEIAEESCRIVSATDFYPPRTLEQQYVVEYSPVVDDRLLLAGARLARLLNENMK
jgi:hypothetical protein